MPPSNDMKVVYFPSKARFRRPIDIRLSLGLFSNDVCCPVVRRMSFEPTANSKKASSHESNGPFPPKKQRWQQPVLNFSAADMTPQADIAEAPQLNIGSLHAESLFDFIATVDETTGTIAPNPLDTPFVVAVLNACEPTPVLVGNMREQRLPQVESVLIASGQKAKARDILAAISALKSIEHGGRDPTSEERRILARFCGFGPVALNIFRNPVTGDYKDGWHTIGEELKTLLTPEEYDSAKRTTFNAFYTSSTVITAMHAALNRLGVPADALVLEPGCGPGRFLYLAPEGMRFIGVEMDGISGRIAKALHPGQDIRIENFCHSRLPQLDAVIGNVPFADLKLDYNGQRFALHDYFFAKSVDSLKPGGVLALVTSHFTLDKQNAAIREYLASKADFVGAIRLPSDAFRQEGTAVVTDIILMRKRSLDDPPNHIADWLTTKALSIEGQPIAINAYFHTHPEMVLGTWSGKDTLYGGEGYSVASNGDLSRQLNQAMNRLPQFETFQASPVEPVRSFTPPPMDQHISEGSLYLNEDRTICQIIDGESVPVVYGGAKLNASGTMTSRRLAALIGLRDRARRVLLSQNEGWPEEDRIDARRELNWAYDRFVAAYGPINKTTLSETRDGLIRRMPNIVKFREDPDAMLVLSLEHYNEETRTATKAAIMQRDVVGKTAPITSVRSAVEGLLVSLNHKGTVDLPFMGSL